MSLHYAPSLLSGQTRSENGVVLIYTGTMPLSFSGSFVSPCSVVSFSILLGSFDFHKCNPIHASSPSHVILLISTTYDHPSQQYQRSTINPDHPFTIIMCNHFNTIKKIYTCRCQILSTHTCVNWEINWQHNEICMLDHFEITRRIDTPCPRHAQRGASTSQPSKEKERELVNAVQSGLRKYLEAN